MRGVDGIRWAATLLLAFPGAVLALTVRAGGHRLDLDGEIEVRQVFEANRSTPRDRTQELVRLRFAAELTDWLRFESTTMGINGGPRRKATKSGTFNFDDVFQDVDPSVEFEEAYFDIDFERFSVRLGKQKVHWGKLDRTQPNDLMNPYRFEDPFMEDPEERKIGIPAVQLDWALPAQPRLPQEPRLTLVWAPFYVPFRFPAAGERWFPPAVIPPATFRIPAGLVDLPGGGSAPALDVPVTFRTRNVSPPARRLENSALGLRASAFFRGIDFALYYYRGFDIQPAFRLLAEAFAPRLPAPPGFDLAQISATTTVEPVFDFVQSWGADAAYALGPFTFRLEGAYLRGRPFVRDLRFLVRDPAALKGEIENAVREFAGGATSAPINLGISYVERDAVEWGFGADYSHHGWFALLQVNQTDVLNNSVDLLIADVETRFTADFHKNFWRDKLRARLVALYGLESDYTVLMPRVTYYLTDRLDFRAGYVAIFGSRNSVLGQYKSNDQGYIRARFSF